MAYKQLKNAPLILVLAQLRFTPYLKMHRCIPDVQEELRKVGFPLFKEEQVREFMLPPAEMAEPKVRQKNRWIFSSKDQTSSVVLTEDFLVLETNAYTVFADFLKQYEEIGELVVKSASLEVTERIGLRYLNLLRDEEKMKADEMIAPPLRGVSAEHAGMEDVRHNTVTRGRSAVPVHDSESGTIVVRTSQPDDGHFLPPDLRSSQLKFDIQLKDNERIIALDIDHYVTLREDLTMSMVTEVLDRLHDGIENAFRGSVTEKAIEVWS